ncbi:MAG: efflux RND transporter periplasmic adaptor subunit [Acidobacteriia bacterium]|nr:efflux RND transporter periplasmic adaptor subunit [Terriglobia bacterium]
MSERRVLVVLGAVALIAAAGAGWLGVPHLSTGEGGAAARAGVARYHCPMHPTVVSERPGDCSICGMRLVPMEEDPAAAPAPDPKKRTLWRSTMNPSEVSDQPGKDSMGMERVPVESEETAPRAAPAVPGLATVRMTTRKQQLIGVRTSDVVRARFLRTLRTVGHVTYDETNLRQVHTKISGYVEKLYANATGEVVRKDEPLVDIFSPELLASQQEYLVALEARKRTAGSSIPSVASSGDELVASARRRLELFDLSDGQIREVEQSGRARRTVTLYAPISGTILERQVTEGQRIETQTELLKMADLSRVWILASVYEYELPFVRLGQKATLKLAYLPDKTIEGRVAFVYPVLDAATRTAQVRIEVPNPGLTLKPDMYAEVTLSADLGERTAVPASAVMDTGTRSIAFVDQGDGTFEPRDLKIGLRLPDSYEVLDGLAPGEKVLTSANFFVDSESKLKAALAAMAANSTTPEPQPHKH